MKSGLFRKSIVFASITLLLLTGFSTIVSSIYKIEDTDDVLPSTISGDGETRYWAVIATAGINPNQVIISARDAQDMYSLLVKHGWEKNNIKCLIEEEATREAIMDTFQWLNNSGEDEDDVIFFFFGFHGHYMEDQPPLDEPDNKDGFFCPFDFEMETWENAILDDELGAEFDKLKSRNIVAIINTCSSGEQIDGSSDLCGSGRVILTACEVDGAGCPLYTRMHWLFPYYLIGGFKGRADNNKDKWVSAEEAFGYAELPTMIRSTIFNLITFGTLITQHPQIYDGWPSEENNGEELNLIDLKKGFISEEI